MQTLQWQPVKAKEFTEAQLILTQKHPEAFERAGREHGVRKSTITVAESAVLELPTIYSEPGVSIIEVFQKPFSLLHLSYLQNSAATDSTALILRIHLDRFARLESFAGMFGSSSSSLFLETTLDGEDSSVHERTVFFGDGEQNFDMFSTTIMRAKQTTALVESKGILRGRAQARFDGGITMKETAKHSNAKLLEHTLLLSPDAKMNAVPGLTIETNDVLAAHSAGMTRIDDEQLFYCKSRGIEEDVAVRLIGHGFLAQLYDKLSSKKVIYQLIEKKLCKV